MVFLLDSSVSVSESGERETLLVTRVSSRGIVSADSFLSVTFTTVYVLLFMKLFSTVNLVLGIFKNISHERANFYIGVFAMDYAN